MAEVMGVDKDRKQVRVRDGAESVANHDLILATGVHGSYFDHDDGAQWAPTMKTLADAEMLRRRIVSTLEQADQQRDPVVRKQLLTFVLVGAGPLAASCPARWLRRSVAGCPPRIGTSMRVTRGSSWFRLDPRAGDVLGKPRARRRQRAAEPGRRRACWTGCRAGRRRWRGHRRPTGADAHRAVTAGVAASPAGRWLGVETDRAGRVVVGRNVRPGYRISFVGDTAHIENNGKPLPAWRRWHSRAASTPGIPSAHVSCANLHRGRSPISTKATWPPFRSSTSLWKRAG